MANEQGDWQSTRDYFLRAREILVRLGAETDVSILDWNLANLAIKQGDLVEARLRYVSYGNARWVQVDPIGRDMLEADLAYIDIIMGNKKDARQRLLRALKANKTLVESEGTEQPFVDPRALEALARLDISEESAERAALLFGASRASREKIDFHLSQFERPFYDDAIAEVRAILGEAAFEQAFAKGQAMSLEQAIEFALQEAGQ
jgi:hypothetical protein